MEIIKNKLKILSNHRYQIFLWGLVFSSLAAFFVLPLLASADTPDPSAADALNQGESWFKKLIYGVVVGVFGRILLFGAGILSFAVNYFVIGAGEVFTEWGVGYAVDQTWSTVRDFFNLTFIFGLVYIGFKMILDSDDSRAQKTLLSLIGAALLVNFSLFITKFVVDVANSAAAMIAMALRSGDGTVITSSLGDGLINLLHLSSALSINIGAAEAGEAVGMPESATKAVVIAFITAILFSIAAFTFAVGGILLIVRFIVLAFYMIFSPLMFLGWVFPDFNGFSKKYWRDFLYQAFMAPAYLFCLYFSVILLQNFEYSLPSGGLDLSFIVSELGENSMLAAFYYVFAIILFLGSAAVAKKMAKDGGGAVMNTTLRMVNRAEKVGGNALKVVTVGAAAGTAGVAVNAASGATFGVAARGGRRIIGGGADKWRNSKTAQNAARAGGVTGFLAKRSIDVADVAAEGNYDVRSVGGVGKKLGIGTGKKTSYAKLKEERQKKIDKLVERRTKDVDDDDVFVANRAQQVKDEETTLKGLQTRLASAPDSEKADLATQITQQKAKIKVAQDRVKLEKQRERIGSTYSETERNDLLYRLNTEINAKEDILLESRDKLVGMRQARATAYLAQDTARVAELDAEIKVIEDAEAALPELKNRARAVKKTSLRGYASHALPTGPANLRSRAGVANLFSRVGNFVTGTTTRIENEAAEASVKRWTKQAHATQSELLTESLLSALKNSSGDSEGKKEEKKKDE